MKNRYFLSLFFFLSLTVGQCLAQKKDSTWVGGSHGIVWDREHNAVLRAATVAIYFAKDSTLIGYRLTNNYGEFDYKGLPFNIPLKLIASYIGYKSSTKIFSLSSAKNDLDIGHVDLTFAPNELQEVVVRGVPPPVQMKGDTLEFNAGAFKLDPNAQTEDLLRVLPGISIWADGMITVNGREIKSVLVNGKPFFGGDARIATQNIPKNAVDKIQVYQKNKDPKKLIDSTSEINIKLKKGKGEGYFGKISGGYGAGEHYDGDGSINFFNGSTQIGLALSGNNVNKVANDINFILRNSTFKGNGANVDYQSDFGIEGINKFIAGGLIFQHDFINNPDFYNNNRITALYFVKNNRRDLLQTSQTITTLDNGLFFRQQNTASNASTQKSQNASTTYEKISDGNKVSAEGSFSSDISNSQGQNRSQNFDQNSNLLSTNSIFNRTDTRTNDFNLKAAYTHKAINNDRSWLSRYELGFKMNVNDNQIDNNYSSAYIPAVNPEEKINFDRRYNNKTSSFSNNVSFNLPNFGAAVFGDYKFAGIATGLESSMRLTANKVKSDVSDRDTATNQYMANSYLTNNRSETVLDMRPALTLSKSIYRGLSNRYEKDFSAVVNIGMQLYDLNSSSEKLFQQFVRSYQKFTPSVRVSYLNRQFGEFTNSISLQVNASSQYPTVQQLAPLVDSANINFIQKGNSNLKEQDTRELTLTFQHTSEKSTNILTWLTSLRAGYIRNYFTSSSVIDNLGRTVYTTVNADGYRYVTGTGELKKAFKWTNNQIQLSVSPVMSISRSPSYVNGVFSYFNNFSLSYNPGIRYSYKNWLDINFVQKQTYNRYVQKSIDAITLSSLVSQTAASINVNCTPKLTIGSNAAYTRNSYNEAQVKRFTIWNASVNYKFLKDNVAEIKLSALDILHQNTGLTNYGLNNSITQGSVNMLQQYFMLGIAYYPRKFGK